MENGSKEADVVFVLAVLGEVGVEDGERVEHFLHRFDGGLVAEHLRDQRAELLAEVPALTLNLCKREEHSSWWNKKNTRSLLVAISICRVLNRSRSAWSSLSIVSICFSS